MDLYEELRTKIVSALEVYFDKNVEHAQCIIQRVFEAYLSRVAGSESFQNAQTPKYTCHCHTRSLQI